MALWSLSRLLPHNYIVGKDTLLQRETSGLKPCPFTKIFSINNFTSKVIIYHSDLNDQNSFHSTIDTHPGVPGVSKNPDNQTEVYSGQLER